MKRYKLIIILLILTQAVSAADVSPICIDGIYYILNASTKQAEVTFETDCASDYIGGNPNTYKGTVTIPATISYKDVTYDVTSIHQYAFHKSSELKDINLPNSILHIGSFAFDGCEKLQSVRIPKSVIGIEECIFNACNSITSIIVDKDNKVYDSRNDCNAIIHTATNELIQGCKNTTIPNTITRIGNMAFQEIITLTSIDIPNSVTSIGDAAFMRTGIKEIVLPNSVIYLGAYAFNSCYDLTSITLSESLENLQFGTFEDCYDLTSITIPASVVSIDAYAIYKYIGDVTIYLQSTTPPYIDGQSFSHKWVTNFATIHVPVGYKDTYLNNDAWKDFTIIDDIVIPEKATSISTLNSINSTPSESFFTLSGKRLSTPCKGINIINGKKNNIK